MLHSLPPEPGGGAGNAIWIFGKRCSGPQHAGGQAVSDHVSGLNVAC